VTSLLQRLANTPPGTWVACPRCAAPLYGPRLRHSRRVCPECSHHLPLTLAERIDTLVDAGSFVEADADLAACDPLSFTDTRPYRDRLAEQAARSGRADAAAYGTSTVGGRPVVLCVLDFAFMGGSMGSVVGEKVALAGELALRHRTPLITCSSSGGARMQEGALSLLQMAKTADTMRRLAAAGVPHFCVLADPVYGGVMASFASLADVIVAEPGTRAGFAGPRVIAQTIRQELPAGFQSAEFLLRQGHIDAVVPRSELGAVLERLVAFHTRVERGAAADRLPRPRTPADPAATRTGTAGSTAGFGGDTSDHTPDRAPDDAWDGVRLARHPDRPLADEYLAAVVDDFIELRGDRWSEDDPAIRGGLALLDGTPVVVVAHRKGRGTQNAVARNFGMPHPSGYRKARRLMEYAERFGVPLVTLVDTPGAYPGVRAEEGNQSGAIAANLAVLAGLRTPVVAVVVGEGGSGGALALAVSDRLLMLANATLSVISPEGAAAILFGDPGRAPEVARALRLTAPDLVSLGIVDEIVPEPAGGAHTDSEATLTAVRAAITRQVAELSALPIDDLLHDRHRRLRSVGSLDRRTSR